MRADCDPTEEPLYLQDVLFATWQDGYAALAGPLDLECDPMRAEIDVPGRFEDYQQPNEARDSCDPVQRGRGIQSDSRRFHQPERPGNHDQYKRRERPKSKPANSHLILRRMSHLIQDTMEF